MMNPMRKAVRSSEHVLAPSHFVKEFLSKEWGLPETKISVVYPGSESVAPSGVAKPPGDDQPLNIVVPVTAIFAPDAVVRSGVVSA